MAVSVSAVALALVLGPRDARIAAQAPASTITLDVQVVDRDGAPVAGLGADKFNVEIGGRGRRVVSAELVDAAAAPSPDSLEGRQVYFLAIDALSFGPGASNAVVAATKAFVDTLPSGALAGLVTFPSGPSVELTNDRAALLSAVDGVAGVRQVARSGQFGVSAGDAAEFLSAGDPLPITQRFCGAELSADNACPQLLEQEMNLVMTGLETQARSALGRLSEFATRLGTLPGRKVLVVVSAGMPVAERSGGRPDVGELPTQLAEASARAGIAFYTLFLDRLQDAEGGGRQGGNASRDRELLARWLDQFSTANGGALVRIQPGQMSEAYARIARETVSYYRLVVEGAAGDASPRPQRLRVRVDQRGATVRSRTLVAAR
jgi:VWFA-related protein